MSTFQNQTPSSQKVSNAEKAIHSFLAEKPTLSSHSQKDYQVSVYKQFGHGRYSYELARDLLGFRDAVKTKNSPQSLVAVFEQCDDLSAAEFEKCLWKELSDTAFHPELSSEESVLFGHDADEETFFFTLDGTVFAVQAMHRHHADSSKRFPFATLFIEVAPPEKVIVMGPFSDLTRTGSDKTAGALFQNSFMGEEPGRPRKSLSDSVCTWPSSLFTTT
jgi:FPC/CPF motif-containing protein YcgG